MENILENLSYYEILEVSQNADKITIKKAYKTMAKKYHPDKNQGDPEAEQKFKLCNEAYQVLSDDNKRSVYDRYGKEGLQGMGGSSRASGMGGFEDLGSIFEEMFGMGGNQARRSPADIDNYALDINYEMTISFHEAVFGCDKKLKYSYKKACDSCHGTGAKDGKLSTCPECDGQGQVFTRQGFMTFSQTCPRCHGIGSAPASKCSSCRGKGYEEIKEDITINVPKGIDSGNRLRVSDKGNVGKKGNRGDLYVTFNVLADKHFIRQDNDIFIEIPVFFTQAILGDEIAIPSLTGELKLKLDIGTKDKQQFRFANEGIDDVHGHAKGSLFAQINLKYPKKLTAEQIELLIKLQNSFDVESKPHENVLNSVIDKMKKWFK